LHTSVLQDSWEPEEHVPPELIAAFAAANPALFEERVAAAEQPRLMAQATRVAPAGGNRTAAAAAGPHTNPPEAVPVVVHTAQVALTSGAAENGQQQTQSPVLTAGKA
jgi:hypothetical protein